MKIRSVLGLFEGLLLTVLVDASESLCKSSFLPYFSISLRAAFTAQGFETNFIDSAAIFTLVQEHVSWK